MRVVQLVPHTMVHQSWGHVEPHLASALEHSQGDITIDQLRADLGQNRVALYWAVDDGKVIGAAAVTFQNQRNARVAFVVAIGGRWIASKELAQQFFALLKSAGATRVSGVGRDSIVRLWERYGLRKKYTIFEAPL